MKEDKSKDETIDGAKIAARILNSLGASHKEKLVKSIQEAAPQVMTKIEENLVSFDDVADVTDKGMQVLLKAIEHRDLVLSLQAAKPEVKEAIFKNMTERKKKIIEEDLTSLAPLSPIEVEQAQKRIVVKLDELRTKGVIQTGSKSNVWA